jgi:hypothetical protein
MGNVCSGEGENKQVEVVDARSTTPAEEAPAEPKLQEKPLPVIEEGPCKTLTIRVMCCRGLRNADWSWLPGKDVSDAYVLAKVGDKEILRTKTIPNTLEPYFDEEFEYSSPDLPAEIKFEVWDKDLVKPDDLLGCAVLKKDSFTDKGFNGEIELADADKCNKAYLKVMLKKAGNDYPTGPQSEFKITLKKDKLKSAGFDVDTADKERLFIVSDSFKGPAKEHNEKADPVEQIKKMQFITAVNGICGDSKLMEKELKAKEEVTLTIRRPMVFTIAVEKKGQFGMVMGDCPTSSYVNKLVEDKGETCIKTWNENHKDKQVQVGDRIIVVNGKMGKGKELTAMLKKDGPKQVVICRPSPDNSFLHWDFWF